MKNPLAVIHTIIVKAESIDFREFKDEALRLKQEWGNALSARKAQTQRPDSQASKQSSQGSEAAAAVRPSSTASETMRPPGAAVRPSPSEAAAAVRPSPSGGDIKAGTSGACGAAGLPDWGRFEGSLTNLVDSQAATAQQTGTQQEAAVEGWKSSVAELLIRVGQLDLARLGSPLPLPHGVSGKMWRLLAADSRFTVVKPDGTPGTGKVSLRGEASVSGSLRAQPAAPQQAAPQQAAPQQAALQQVATAQQTGTQPQEPAVEGWKSSVAELLIRVGQEDVTVARLGGLLPLPHGVSGKMWRLLAADQRFTVVPGTGNAQPMVSLRGGASVPGRAQSAPPPRRRVSLPKVNSQP